MPPHTALCYVLVSRDRAYVWCGPGMRPVRDLPLCALVYWTDRRAAETAARALRAAIGLDSHVQAVYLPRT